jgi:hypothetical protein
MTKYVGMLIVSSIICLLVNCFSLFEPSEPNKIPQFVNNRADTVTIKVDQTFTDTLRVIDDGVVTFKVLQGPESMALQDSVISWTPISKDTGIVQIVIVALDQYEDADTISYYVRVQPKYITIDRITGDWFQQSYIITQNKTNQIVSYSNLNNSTDTTYITITNQIMIQFYLSCGISVMSKNYLYMDSSYVNIKLTHDTLQCIDPDPLSRERITYHSVKFNSDTLILTSVTEECTYQKKLIRSHYAFPSVNWIPFYTFWNVYGTSCKYEWETDKVLGLWMIEINGNSKDTIYIYMGGHQYDGTVFGYYYNSQAAVLAHYDEMKLNSSLSRVLNGKVSLYVSAFLSKALNPQLSNICLLMRFDGDLIDNTVIKNGKAMYSENNGNTWIDNAVNFTGTKLCYVDQE